MEDPAKHPAGLETGLPRCYRTVGGLTRAHLDLGAISSATEQWAFWRSVSSVDSASVPASTQAGKSALTISRRLTASPRLDRHGDLDDRDLAAFDLTRFQDRDPAGRRRGWPARRRWADESQGRRIAAFRKPIRRFWVSAAQSFRGCSVRDQELGELGKKVIAFLLRGDVEQGLRGRLRLPGRRLVGIETQLSDSVFILLRSEVTESRQPREVDQVAGGEVVGAVVLATVSGRPFLRPVAASRSGRLDVASNLPLLEPPGG